jgi:hypothetical protein
MRQCALAVLLLLLATEVGGEEPGLSKGPADPADIASRCAVMAGRTDRAYLNCAEHDRPTRKPRDPSLSDGPIPRFRDTITDGQPGRRYRPPGQ